MINVIFNQFDYEVSERKKEIWDRYNKVIQWGRKHPLRFAERFLGIEFTDHQKYVFMSSWTAKFIVWLMGRNSGKALDLETPVYMEDLDNAYCKKTIGELRIGDKIYDGEGKLTEVIHLNPIIFDRIYQVIFEDGETIESNEEHLWEICFSRDDNYRTIVNTGMIYDSLRKNSSQEIFVDGFDLYDCKKDKKKVTTIIKTDQKKAMRCITVSNKSGTFLCGDKMTVTHNSFLSAPYIMTRSMLIPNHETYIMSVTGPQAQETFKKMESLAMGKIASIVGTNHIFLNEVVKQNIKDSGFTHDKNSYSVELYNGSKVRTLNSVPKNVVGIRSHLNVYDEAGKISKEFFDLTRPFTTQNTNFVTGANFNQKCLPKQFPTQILYCSSAEDIFTELWQAYKMGAEEMIMGNPDYFVCDISCEFSFAPTMNGKPYAPLLERSVVEQALAQNAFRANREYYNKFDVTGGQDNVVSATKLQRCSEAYFPVFEHEEGKRYIIVNDPSSKIDNSFVLIAELFLDPDKGYMCRIINARNLVEHRKDGSKKIIQKPEQIEILKKYIVDYNGPANDYDNLEQVIIDAGAGGGGFDMYQFILPGWTETLNGQKINHVGIIDMEDKYCQEERDKFPEAKDILTLANFKRDKVAMYDATMDALNQELVIFPKDSNGRGEMEFEDVDQEGRVTYRYERLNSEQLRAVVEVEMLKYELMAMEKTKNSSTGKISFDLMPSKKSEGLHDDRADCVAMLCYYLMQLRAKNRMQQFNKAKPDYAKILEGKKQIAQGRFGGANPFNNRGANPFLR